MRERIAKFLYALGDSIGGLDSRAERETKHRTMQVMARFAQSAEERFERAEEESRRRDEEGLLDYKVPKQWRSWFYMRQGYRVVVSDDESQGHWQGGAPYHEGAICPICNKPFLLFWDINCRDSRIRGESTELFGQIDRLPLYYCCRRPEPTIYQVLPGQKVRTFRPELRGGEETPFEAFPDVFERRAVTLEPIPRMLENLMLIHYECPEWLDAAELRQIRKYADQNNRDLPISQFGGIPNIVQGHREIDCPNPDCATHRMGSPHVRNNRHYQLKELAVICDDADFAMKTHAAQIAFHICWHCNTVNAQYEID